MNAVDLYPHLQLEDHEQLVAEPPRIKDLKNISDELLWQTAIEWVSQYHNHMKKIAGGILKNGLIEFDDLIHDASLRAFEILKKLTAEGAIEAFVPQFFATFKYDCMLQANEIAPIAPGDEVAWDRIVDHNSEDYWSITKKIDDWEQIDEVLEKLMDPMTNKQKKVISLVTGFHTPRKTKEEIAVELKVSVKSREVTVLTTGFRAPALTSHEAAIETGTSQRNINKIIEVAIKRAKAAQTQGALTLS